MPATVKCPICQKPVPWTEDQKFRPFCSERCKLIDLGEWASGSYAIPSDSSDAESPDGGSEDEAGS
jgi:endogenous inhibitor of DNA gyrase (YacG/DUF329 family)